MAEEKINESLEINRNVNKVKSSTNWRLKIIGFLLCFAGGGMLILAHLAALYNLQSSKGESESQILNSILFYICLLFLGLFLMMISKKD